MLKRPLLLLTVLVSLIAAGPLAAAQASSVSDVKTAYAKFRYGLAHRQGALTCGRMTLHFRTQLIAIAKGQGVDATCTTIVDRIGPQLFRALEKSGFGPTLISVSVRASSATARTAGNGRVKFRKFDGKWKVDG